MNAIKVKDLASLVLKAYVHFGVTDSRINRRWLVEYDQYGAEKAVAHSFNVFNGESIITMEQICQRGREIACEDQGALYQSWCAIKEIMENDWLYEEQPFEPAKSIPRTKIFEEYLMIRDAHAHISRQQAAQEFKTLERSIEQERLNLEPMDIYLMMDEAKDAFERNEAILGTLAVIMKTHFAEPSCQPMTVDMPMLEEAHEVNSVESEPMDNIVETVEEADYEEQPAPVKKNRNGRGNLLDCQAELDKIYGGAVELISEYHGFHDMITVRCKHCGMEWKRSAESMFLSPHECPRCLAKKVIENPNLDVGAAARISSVCKEEILKAFIDKFCDGEYSFEFDGQLKRNTVLKFCHEACGTTFKATADKFKARVTNGDIPCPNCCMDKESINNTNVNEEEVLMSDTTDAAKIGLFELQKYYNKAYAKVVGGQLETGWKSMTNSMRAVMPEQYAYEKVSKKGKHVDLPVSIEDIEWITYYYADMAKTPTTDNNALNRAIRNSKLWAEILAMVKPLFVKEEPQVEQKSAEQVAKDDGRIITIEEQEEAKRMQKLQELQQRNLRKGLEEALKKTGNTHFANQIDAIIKMIGVAKSMHTLPDEVVAVIANSIGVKIGEVSTKEFEALKNELEQLKITNADLRSSIEEYQRQLDEANEWKENVKGLLASA